MKREEFSFELLYNSPVVMRADMIAAGDHVGWAALLYAAAPVT